MRELSDKAYDFLRSVERCYLPVIIAAASALAIEVPATAPIVVALFAAQRILAAFMVEASKHWKESN